MYYECATTDLFQVVLQYNVASFTVATVVAYAENKGVGTYNGQVWE